MVPQSPCTQELWPWEIFDSLLSPSSKALIPNCFPLPGFLSLGYPEHVSEILLVSSSPDSLPRLQTPCLCWSLRLDHLPSPAPLLLDLTPCPAFNILCCPSNNLVLPLDLNACWAGSLGLVRVEKHLKATYTGKGESQLSMETTNIYTITQHNIVWHCFFVAA